ncbi:hypothetical protein SAMN05443999_10645 [Roseovarius azorensis]|uniref:Flagellar FliJ protein n=1 Tax=Roseovarius azorensis TaxID=1287727 RepID=A0A1H7R2V7_9RHOB|nr:hypothetical protein [Roseovarius azorensis]SEL54492.1 hypothetical protein SAMN05443999_10645 [Roseovarius azorensis]
MTQRQSCDLVKLTLALFQKESTKLRDLNRQEARLRAELARLDSDYRASQRLTDSDMQGLREVGADLLWLGWVGRNRADMQIELARVLAGKGQMIRHLGRAFGRHQAALTLHAEEIRHDREKALVREENDIAALARLRHPMPSGRGRP